MFNRLIEAWKYIKLTFKKHMALKEDCHTTISGMHFLLNKEFKNCFISVTDERNIFIYKDEMERIAKVLNVTRFMKWRKEIHDCDNFAFEFKGIMSRVYGKHAFGIVFVTTPEGGHALNCFIDEFGKFNYFEPQNNNIFGKGDYRYNVYKPYMIVI